MPDPTGYFESAMQAWLDLVMFHRARAKARLINMRRENHPSVPEAERVLRVMDDTVERLLQEMSRP